MTITYHAITTQHEDWDDSGGDHDPFVVPLTDDQLNALHKVGVVKRCYEKADFDEMVSEGDSADEIAAAQALMAIYYYGNVSEQHQKKVDFPVLIHSAFNIWTK